MRGALRLVYRLKVKDIAQQKGVSQRQFMLHSGVDIKTIKRVFRNPSTANITMETLDKLSVFLKVDISELIESVPTPGEEELFTR
jgi:transcriptional regulator with XRE-family HTH domain